MTTIKSYTDIEQSKLLAEILPIESADMAWCNNSIRGVNYTDEYSANLYTVKEMQECFDKALNGWDKYWKLIPCWSLAALLSTLPIVYINNKKEVCGPLHIDVTDSETPFVLWYVNILHKGNIVEIQTQEYDNMIDACYEMIIKLHEEKLL